MAKTDNIRVRIEPELKAQAIELFNNCGMTVSDAITIFIHQSLKTGGLPFDVIRNPQGAQAPSKQTN